MTSIVTIQLGQCGNQVGGSLFDQLAKEFIDMKAEDDTWNLFFRTSVHPSLLPTARAILIDMEPKVISETIKNTQYFHYDASRQYFKQSGSGNNWAYGFNVHGPSSWEENVQDQIRKEVEFCDCLGGFLFIQSLGGGTGSGLGAFITQEVREEYKNAFIVNQVVWPYSTGEVIVQNYNTLLSVSQLYETSDAILLSENDHLNRVCNHLLGISYPSFKDLNSVIASQLANVLLPLYCQRASKPLNLWLDIVRHLCSHPNYRILNTMMTPQVSQASKAFSKFLWPSLLKNVHQMLITDTKMDANINWKIKVVDVDKQQYSLNKSVGNVLILRGSEQDMIQDSMISPLRHSALYAPFQNDPLLICTHPHPFNATDKSCCLLSNSQSIIQPLDRMLSKASEMFHARAYIYQYLKYGIDEDYFQHCFQQLEYILHNYRSI